MVVHIAGAMAVSPLSFNVNPLKCFFGSFSSQILTDYKNYRESSLNFMAVTASPVALDGWILISLFNAST